MDVRRRIIGGFVSGSSGGIIEPIDTDNYLTIYALEDGLTASLSTNSCEYCIDGDGNWLSLAADSTTQSINTGHRLSFRGELIPNGGEGIGTFTISQRCNLEGNCMSILFGDNAASNTSLSGKDYAFSCLFYNCTNIVSVSENFLPATTLSDSCYTEMFSYCTNLTTAPELPATTLAYWCYQYMFSGCTSLTTAPALPATSLAAGCYEGMFSNCLSLTIPPLLPATTLVNWCYSAMFEASGITTPPALPATTLTEQCYINMFAGCPLTTAPALPATTLAGWCYSSMFSSCWNLHTAPELSATTLADGCYQDMFDFCENLTTAPALPATILASRCYSGMFAYCCNLNYIKMLATDIAASDCLTDWVSGVASTGTFVKNKDMTSLPIGDSGIPEDWTVIDDTSGSSTTDNYLTIYALEDGLTASLSTNACEYCVDGDGNWKSLAADTATESINAGHRLSFRGELTPSSSKGIGTFTIAKKCNLEGNCMSMLFGDDAINNLSLSGTTYAFYNLFYNCTNIVSVSENFLPATTLSSNCYHGMFSGCTSLTTAPALPAPTAEFYCYTGMFNGCASLTTAPELPATTLNNSCYYSMFKGCTSLTAAPSILPATTLSNSCYYQMFYGCTSLTTVPALPATTLAGSCYRNMFSGCTNLTISPALPATTLSKFCYYQMFYGCTSLTIAPTLPARQLAEDCYGNMFSGCTNLTISPSLPATTLADDCYSGMFSGTNVLPDCSNINFASQSVLASGGLKSLFSGTKVTDDDLNRILPKNSNGKYHLPATTLASGCYSYMFSGCDNLITAPELPATTLADSCYERMFYQCDNLVTGPTLPATTLVDSCYKNMFSHCYKLNYIKMLATDISASECLYSWVHNVGSNGTFVKNINMTSLSRGISGIPSSWTVIDEYIPTTCTSLSITADDVSGRDTNTTIYYTAVTNGGDSSGNIINNVTITGTAASAAFPQNTSTTNTVQRTISYTYLDKTATTTITQGVWRDSYYTIDLNNQWQKSTTISNPDATLYDGVYESFSNYNIGSTSAIMKITIVGYSDFKFYIRSYGESNSDYVMVSQLDQTINNSTSYSNTTLVKAHTRGNQQSGTALSNYKLVEFTNINGVEHVITIVYRKDGTVNSGNDRGYVLIPKDAGTSSGESGGDSGGSVDINNYLTIIALENGLTASLSDNACEYCIDGNGNWLSLAAGATTQSINTGQTLSFRGNLTPTSSKGIGTFTISKKCNLEGNCMSMLFGDNASDNNSLSGKNYAFYNLFYNCTNIVSVSENFLPATTLTYRCYYNMFYNCYSLTTAPELRAARLGDSSYAYMFYGCSKLNYIKMLATDTSQLGCLVGWVVGVSSTGTFVKHPNMTSLSTGSGGIPAGWTIINDGDPGGDTGGDPGGDSGSNSNFTFNLSDAIEVNDYDGYVRYHFTPTNITQQILEYAQSLGLDFNASNYIGSEIFFDEGLISIVGDAIIDGACHMVSAVTSESESSISLYNGSGLVELIIAKDNSYVHVDVYN